VTIMAKVFRPSSREAKILSRIESSKEYARRKAIQNAKDLIEPLSNAIAMKLVEDDLVETTNKNVLEEQITKCIDKLSHSDDFDVDYKIAPFRHIVQNPNVVSLYLTAFVIETLINHKVVVDIYGSDEEIYFCINRQVSKLLA
jgi:predicted RNA-binding protein with EMAP domain